MIHLNIAETLTAAVVDDNLALDTVCAQATHALIDNMRDLGMEVIEIACVEDARSVIVSLPELDCILIDWDLDDGAQGSRAAAADLIELIRERNQELPILLLADSGSLSSVPLAVVKEVDEYVLVAEDTPGFIAGRVEAAARRYRSRLLPPFFGEMVRFSEDFEYSWHTPGHAGGTAFRKSPAGRMFFRFFGEQLFRSDLSISVDELGSLLDHSGPVREAERFAAKVFGADQTYFVTNGTSTSNKVVFFGSVTSGDVVLADRNCHKSIEHALTMTHAVPVYLLPSRNRYGIIGPIHPGELEPNTIRSKIEASPLVENENARAVHAVITNSTYDGLCYLTPRVEELIGPSVERLHYDEAWYGYARFNPMYRDRFGMREGPRDPDAPTIFATQSTHKLLAALSQASMVHIRNGRAPIDHTRFNEAFMMHGSTSPLYTIIASCDVSSKMMEGASGRTLTDESIAEAVAFRKAMARLSKEVGAKTDPGNWWFGMWQPDTVTDPSGKTEIAFADAPEGLLSTEPSCWVLHPDEKWHGFDNLEDDYCMLDPIKVTVLMPGIAEDGSFKDWGIPAAIVVRYLDTRGIVNEKSGDYCILFLFSMGITKGKWGTLVTELLDFKRAFDEGALVDDIFPDLVAGYPERYRGMSLPELAARMHSRKRDSRQIELLEKAFSLLPDPVMTGAEAYKRLVRDEVEQVPVAKMADRVVATGVVPYPPGIPILMPGESAGGADGPVLEYLRALQDFDAAFPGFEHDIHGVESIDGEYRIYCLGGE